LLAPRATLSKSEKVTEKQQMKVIKPLKQGVLYKTYENDNRSYFVVTVFSFFPFAPAGQLLSEIDMWKFAASELGKETILDFGMPKQVLLAEQQTRPGREGTYQTGRN